jgi:TonB family protein
MFRRCPSLALLLCIAIPGCAQVAQIAHFVSPRYPPLARQALISGQVAVDLSVNTDGIVKKVEQRPTDRSSSHPLLVQWTKDSVSEWKFQPLDREAEVSVVFFYGFSGTTKESNPITTVKVDFHGPSILVFITTDPAPAVHP